MSLYFINLSIQWLNKQSVAASKDHKNPFPYKYFIGDVYKSSEILPFVSGCIQDVAQLIFKGQPSKTLEKHAPILFIKKKMLTYLINNFVYS